MDSVVVLTEFAAAKVNLALHVTGRRADGYHQLDSLVAFARFGDRIAVTPAPEDLFAVDGPFASDVPTDAGNLVIRARDVLRVIVAPPLTPPLKGEGGVDGAVSPSPLRGGVRGGGDLNAVSIRLTKNLPVASGVGGGSSDAAATLKALNQFWGLGLSTDDLARIALPLGADVPMCLSARPLVARGIGDEVTPVSAFPSLGLVLVNPGVAVSTPAVFAALQTRDNPPLPPLPGRFDFHSLRNWLDLTRNDLEPPARSIEPVIGEALAALDRAGSGFSRMSGSGATCFGLFETGNVAKRAAAAIRARHSHWFVAATRTITSEGSHEPD